MKSFNSYISQQSNSFNYDINYVNESLENNVRMINEAKLITEHGKDIDNLLYKFKTYTYNNLYNANSLNEADNTYKLSLNEQQTFRDLMIFICEDYRNKLLEELNIYESLIIDGQLITEGKLIDKVKNKSKNLVANIKQTWELGKDKVNQAIEALKTKIKEVNELIKDFAQKAISTVKEMAVKLIGLLQKFDCTLADLFSKMGFNTDEEEKSVDEIGQQLASNPDYLKKNDVYESYANSLNIISEDDSTQGQGNQSIKDKGETQKQAEKKSTKQMLWESFKQLMIWAGVCVVIPGFVCGLFPGTFIALLVPIVCKLLWNGYKIYKLVKQWKTVRQEWGNYKKSQKIITVISMIASIVALFFNFKSSFEALGKIWEAFVKSGGDLFANANLGIQPDVLTRAFGALVKMIKEGKFSFKDFGESFKAITDSFAEHIPGVNQVVKQAAKVGKSGQELLDEFEKGGFKGSTQAWKDVLKPASLDPSKVTDDGVYDVVFDGNFKSDEAQKLMKWFADNGVKITPEDAFNKGLNKINKLAGSVWGAKIPGDVLQKALDSGIKLGHNGWFSILGGMIDKVIPGAEIINAATSMLFTIPSVEWAPQNNGGFRVRLGGKDDKKNFVYEVAEDGVKKHKVSDYQKEYDKIKTKVAEVNKKFLEDLLKNDKLSDEEKNTVKEKLEKFNSEYKDNINDKECIIFYGTRVEDENTNESFKSLYDYLINEAEKINKKYSIKDVKQNITDLKDYLDKIGKSTNDTFKQDNKDDDNKKDINLYKGNLRMLLQAIFSFNTKNATHDWDYDDDYKNEPYETVKKRVHDDDSENNKFGPMDINYLALCFSQWFGADNEKDYESYRLAFIDLFILRKQLMLSDELNDNIIAAYFKTINHLLNIEKINTDVKDKEWKPKEEWAPLKFNEDKINDDSLKAVEKTEDNQLPDTTKKETEEQLQKDDVVVPNQSEKDNKSDKDKKSENVPVLMLANNYGIDLANATKSGPREDIYALKGIFDSLTFMEIEGGTSVANITKMLGEILHAQTNNLYDNVANRPCIKEKGDKEFKLANEKINKPETERPEFGMLTNQEVTDVLNKPKVAETIIKGKSSVYTIAKTKEDKDFVEKREKDYTKKLENPDEETVKLVKDAYPDAIDKDGKIKKDYKDKDGKTLPQIFAGYALAQHNAKNAKKSKSGGLFSKLVNFVKDLFGGDKEKGKKVNSALKHLNKGLNEGLYENLNKYDDFLESCFARKTLAEYIIEHKR